jgi:predicted nucleic acid-binding protein
MILADTTVLIDIHRGKKEISDFITEFIENKEESTFAISDISIEELYVGLGYTKANLGEEIYLNRKKKIDDILLDFDRLNLTEEIWKKVGIKEGELKNQGIIIDFQDIIIGITAEHYNVDFILTRNPDHFSEFKISAKSYLL